MDGLILGTAVGKFNTDKGFGYASYTKTTKVRIKGGRKRRDKVVTKREEIRVFLHMSNSRQFLETPDGPEFSDRRLDYGDYPKQGDEIVMLLNEDEKGQQADVWGYANKYRQLGGELEETLYQAWSQLGREQPELHFEGTLNALCNQFPLRIGLEEDPLHPEYRHGNGRRVWFNTKRENHPWAICPDPRF